MKVEQSLGKSRIRHGKLCVCVVVVAGLWDKGISWKIEAGETTL